LSKEKNFIDGGLKHFTRTSLDTIDMFFETREKTAATLLPMTTAQTKKPPVKGGLTA